MHSWKLWIKRNLLQKESGEKVQNWALQRPNKWLGYFSQNDLYTSNQPSQPKPLTNPANLTSNQPGQPNL